MQLLMRKCMQLSFALQAEQVTHQKDRGLQAGANEQICGLIQPLMSGRTLHLCSCRNLLSQS